jgi:hypothetical protein
MLHLSLLPLLLAGSASAQPTLTLPVAPGTSQTVAAARPTAADTVQAIHRLFAKRRRVGSRLTVGALGADLVLAGVSAALESTPKSSGGAYGLGIGAFTIGFGGFAIIYGVVAAPVVGVGIQQLIAYRPRREARILAAYETDHRLPAKIGRQLRKHLQQPAASIAQ